MTIFKFLKKVRRHLLRYDPSIKIFIYKQNLIDNLGEYKNKYPKLSFAPVLKSNAYGHGLVEVAEILDKEDIAFFVVDSLPEATILKKSGIKSEIQVVGYVTPENVVNSRLKKVHFTITSLEQLKTISEIASRKLNIHLKIDTGMHRQGILVDEISEAVKLIKENKKINLIGICSHFADADGVDGAFTKNQIEKWNEVVQNFKNEFASIKYFHISATAGTFYSNEAFNNVARLGLGLYGINPSPFDKLNLKPVLQMESIISSVRRVESGDSVGYNATYKIEHPSIIATVPAGYFEGVDRRLSNCGFFKIKETFYPIAGRVSMNITSIDITSGPNVISGDNVVLISSNSKDLNSVENIAKQIKTIPWEILIHIPAHLRRIIV